jgi:hypothetical protein
MLAPGQEWCTFWDSVIERSSPPGPGDLLVSSRAFEAVGYLAVMRDVGRKHG